ncbi:MAG: MFS transporter [Candidatus Helarchaeota archaeon]
MKNFQLTILGFSMFTGTTLMVSIVFHYPTYFMTEIFANVGQIGWLISFLIPTIGLGIGAIAYPISGHLSDNLITKHGKRRPFFFLAIPCGIAFAFVSLPTFIRPIIGFTPTNYMIGFIFILIAYIIYALSWRFVQCPFLALFVDITEPEERIKSSIFLNMCDLAGTGVGILIPLFMPLEISGYIFGAMYSISFIIAFALGPKEDLKLMKTKEEEKKSFVESFKEILSFDVYRNYIISAFFFVLAFQLAINFIMPYLNFVGLQVMDLASYALILLLMCGLLFFVFSKLAKNKGKIYTFKFSLLWGAICFPLLLFVGVFNWGPFTVVHQIVLVAIFIAGGIIGLIIFQYAIMMELGKLKPKMESSFVGIFSSITVFSAPLATLIIGFSLSFFNPITVLIWNGNLGFSMIGVFGGIAFFVSYLFMRLVKYKETPIEEEKIVPVSDGLKEKVENIVLNLDPIQHLKNIDYPRLAGTEGERKAAKYIIDTLKANGCDSEIQEFHFQKSKTLPKILLPIALVGWAILSIFNLIYFDNNLIISIIVLLLPAGVVFAVIKFDLIMKFFLKKSQKKLKEIEDKLKKQVIQQEEVQTSNNIIVKIGPEDAKNHILFTAHYDSISLKLPMNYLMVFGLIGAMGLIVYSIAYFCNVITDLFFDWNFMMTYFIFFLIILIITIVFLGAVLIARMLRTNTSHGIIDDGTGTAILLELSKFLKKQDIKDHKFTIAFFSAEELGLFGSCHHYMNNEFNKEKLHVISIDMIGEKAPISYIKGVNPLIQIPMDPEFNSQVYSIAKKMDIKMKGEIFLYPGSDFAHWLLNGYKSNWLINSSKVIHSKNDNLENLNEDLVTDALKVIVGYLIEFF